MPVTFTVTESENIFAGTQSLSVDIGAADADRKCLVGIAGEQATVTMPSTATLNSVGLTKMVELDHASGQWAQFWIGAVPTGAGSQTFTMSDDVSPCSITIFRCLGASLTAHDTSTGGASSGTGQHDPLTIDDLTIPTNGVGFYIGVYDANSIPTITGATQASQIIGVTTNNTVTTATVSTASTPTVEFDWNATPDDSVLIGVSLAESAAASSALPLLNAYHG